jgi:hypothetical protein
VILVIVSRELGGLELFRLAEPRVTILMSVASPKCRPALNLAEDVKRKRYDAKMAERSEAKSAKRSFASNVENKDILTRSFASRFSVFPHK